MTWVYSCTNGAFGFQSRNRDTFSSYSIANDWKPENAFEFQSRNRDTFSSYSPLPTFRARRLSVSIS